mgnify:CR=1 FL=1
MGLAVALDNRTKYRIASNMARESKLVIKDDTTGPVVRYKVFRIVDGRAVLVGQRSTVSALLRLVEKAAGSKP